MPNGKVIEAHLPPETIVDKVISVFKEFQGKLIILEIENTMFSHGSIEVSLGGWDGSKFITKPKMSLSPNRSCGFSINEMQWLPYAQAIAGTQAVVRSNQPAIFEIKNKRDKDLNCVCVEPNKFPWWTDPNHRIVKSKTIYAKKDGYFKIDGEHQIVAMWYGLEPME